MTDEFLKKNYVPDIISDSIYQIDYDALQKRGVKLITFDIDETIAGDNDKDPPKAAITLIQNLGEKGFRVSLVTNAGAERAKHFGKIIGITYTYDLMKPLTSAFDEILRLWKLKPSQMAHVGNSLLDDIAGGNSAGIITCLVKNVSGNVKKDEVSLIAELKRRHICDLT